MADARTTLSGQGIAVGGGYGSTSRRDPSGHERVQAQRAEAGVREQEARRLGTWKEGVGIMSKQQLASEARDKALWEQNRAAQNQTSMATPPVRNEYDEAGTGMTPKQQDAADANKRKAQEQAYNPRTFQDRQQNAMISAVQEARNAQQMRPATPRPFMGSTAGDVPENRMGVPGASRYADATQGVVPIDPAHQVLAPYSKISYAPFGYAGSPAFRSGQMVRATSAPITNAFGKQTGIAGATRNNWQQAVMAAHPEIGQKGSEFNKRYVQAVKAQTGEFDPMKLAESVKQTLPEQRNEPRNGPPMIEITDKNGNVVERRPIPGPGFRGATPIRDASGNVTGFGPRDPSGNAPEFQPTTPSPSNPANPPPPAAPAAAPQEQPDIDRRNWVDRLTPSDEQIKKFEQNYDAQRSLGGQIVEAVKNPLAWYYSNQNKEINADVEAGNTREARQSALEKARTELDRRTGTSSAQRQAEIARQRTESADRAAAMRSRHE